MIGAARLLKCLAVQHGMVVIVVNHIVGSAQVIFMVVLKWQGSLQPRGYKPGFSLELVEPISVGTRRQRGDTQG